MSTLAHDSTFAHEAEELLEQIEQAALALETEPTAREPIDLLFRAFHTLKGSSGMVGLKQIASFTHGVENALDQVRDGSVSVTPALISLVLAARDHIQHLLGCALEGRAPELAQGDAISASLRTLTAQKTSASDATRAPPRMRTTHYVYFRLKRDASVQLDPSDLIGELTGLGPVEARAGVEADEQFAQAWEVTLTTDRGEDAIRDVFIFAPHGSELRIEQGLSEFVTELPPAPAPIPLVTKPLAPVEAVAPVKGDKAQAARGQDMVRVPSERLDVLMKLVGELVINQSRIQQAYGIGSLAELSSPIEAMERLISELRDSLFSMRMMPIGPTFARYKRLARDLSAQLEKEIELVTEGDDTELDKSVLDQLGDPLVHIIRNSMDHGLETPERREAAGKPRKGRIRLSAAQDGGHVVITVSDDGKGLDQQAIRKKAEEKGLIAPGSFLSEQDTFDLVMRPGFSTAAAVSELSGRGVGMDVVKKTIERLRGTITIHSTQGAGTTIRLSLPLTLAIIDGLVVQVGGESFIVPMSDVCESTELLRAERLAKNGRNAVTIRGELVPYVRLRDLFGARTPEPDVEMIVIVRLDGQRVGLTVDRVLGVHQTVIQSLGPFCRDVELFSGSTIMGDGNVVLILDLPSIVRRAERAFRTVDEDRGVRSKAREHAHHH